MLMDCLFKFKKVVGDNCFVFEYLSSSFVGLKVANCSDICEHQITIDDGKSSSTLQISPS